MQWDLGSIAAWQTYLIFFYLWDRGRSCTGNVQAAQLFFLFSGMFVGVFVGACLGIMLSRCVMFVNEYNYPGYVLVLWVRSIYDIDIECLSSLKLGKRLRAIGSFSN